MIDEIVDILDIGGDEIPIYSIVIGSLDANKDKDSDRK